MARIKSLPIFTYHAISEHKSPIFLSQSSFEKQIAALANAGYRTAALDDSLYTQESAGKSCVICFDDCYEDVYTKAWPVLKCYGFTATLFIITDFCGKTNRWTTQPETVPECNLLTWKQLETLCSCGFQPAAHTKTHPDLTTLTEDQLVDEVFGCKLALEKFVGTPPQVFAYPYGRSNSKVRSVVKEHFGLAVGTDLAMSCADDDMFNIPRIDSYYTSPFMLKNITSAGALAYLEFRNRLRRFRQFTNKRWSRRSSY